MDKIKWELRHFMVQQKTFNTFFKLCFSWKNVNGGGGTEKSQFHP